jgi:FKBP-type peptidyl-prolyl cis-trans isomerase
MAPSSSKAKKDEKKPNTIKAKPNSSKSKIPAASSKGGGTVLDKILHAIRLLQQQGSSSSGNGISRTAITKYLKTELSYDNANAIKTALKKGVSNETLVQTGQSFRVASDPVAAAVSDPKEQLKIEDVKVGGNKKRKKSDDGGEASNEENKSIAARHGDAVTVSYIGTLQENGYEFDRATSFTFILGAGEVIKGWDEGVEGMRIGGKRKLVVPSRLGYGKRGCKPDIPGNATLCFTVTLKKVDEQTS